MSNPSEFYIRQQLPYDAKIDMPFEVSRLPHGESNLLSVGWHVIEKRAYDELLKRYNELQGELDYLENYILKTKTEEY